MVRIGDWIGAGWRTVTAGGNLWGFVLLALLFPLVTAIGNFIVAGAAMAAAYAICLYALRTGKFDFNRIQESVNSDTFVQTLLAYLVTAAIMTVPFMIVYIPMLLMGIFATSTTGHPSAAPSVAFIAVFAVLYLVMIMIALTVHTLYLFPYLLIVDRKMPFWEAMEASRKTVMRNFGGFFLFVLALAGINLLGVITCCVGILVTTPVTWCAIAAAYRDLWPEPQPEVIPEPAPTVG